MKIAPKTVKARAMAQMLFTSAIEAVDPKLALQRALKAHPVAPGGADGRLFVLALGKAAISMATAFQDAVGQNGAMGQIAQMIVVTNPENIRPIVGAEVLATSHPLPSQAGADAANQVEAMLQKAGAQDTVVALISGGGSALLPAPKAGISLEDKIAVNALLLANGLDIRQMNLIRQSLSRLKGGGMVLAAAPAPVVAFILSDVIGDDLAVIASGPTVAPIGTPQEACAILKKGGLWEALPASVQTVLTSPHQVPKTLQATQNILIASNTLALAAMAQAAPISTQIVNAALIGDVEAAASQIIAAAQDWDQKTTTVILFGGETTVTLRGTGLGGRNQELALLIAQKANLLPPNFVFLSGGTDGRDGPTDAAGGMVDAQSWQRIIQGGGDPVALLANNDSNRALALAGDLIITGATGTNVADVQLLILQP